MVSTWWRVWTALLGLGLLAVLGGCASVAPRGPRPVALAPGVYMFAGSAGAADAANLGRIGNSGFIVGPQGVIVVDTGTSHVHGQALLEAIATVTDRPVRLALVTHVRPEFLFGGTAFQARGIPVAMHERSARLMASRCETCLKTLRQVAGEPAMHGSHVYQPDRTLDAAQTLDLIGRPVRVLYFGHSSGPGDIAVLDEQSGVLFAGGLLDVRRVPDIQDSDLPGWHRALAALRELGARRVVPGHGPAAEPGAAIDAVETYLAALEKKTRALVESGASLINVADVAEMPDYEAWDQYEIIHRRNASVAFLRYERELIFKPEPPR
ncbi:MBL fold metallo-hydrolase [Piscinibacter defluvii]|uniref:MBL fold metallo-hydrolase n=1 Tax=Piscinibacter defluvii TaxID=1796922 RepID=UPI000FDD0ECA|nr:MBL fold metallo-hydrolase [Piscinibacter defluvii]